MVTVGGVRVPSYHNFPYAVQSFPYAGKSSSHAVQQMAIACPSYLIPAVKYFWCESASPQSTLGSLGLDVLLFPECKTHRERE